MPAFSKFLTASFATVASGQFGLDQLLGGMMGGAPMGGQVRIMAGGRPVRVVRMGNPFVEMQRQMQGIAEMEAAEELRRALDHAVTTQHSAHHNHDEGIPMELMHSMNTLMHMGSDHSGHIGMTSGIHMEDTKEHFLISGKLHCDHPPKVDVAGCKLIIRGTHVYGNGQEDFQRTYNLPEHLDKTKMDVKFSSKTGAFKVEIPKIGAPQCPAVNPEHHTNMPAEVQAVQQMLSEVFGAHPMMMGKAPVVVQGGRGFMRGKPAPAAKVNAAMKKLQDVVSAPKMQKISDEDVEFVGYFSEEQLPEHDYIGNSTPTLFGAMYGKAHHYKMKNTGKEAKFFAMSIHEAQQPGAQILGHGRIMDEFDMNMIPVYPKDSNFGSRCLDDNTKFCGASHEPVRGYTNSKCTKEWERTFAVYKLKDHTEHVDGIVELADKHGDDFEKAIDEHAEQTKAAEEKNAAAKDAAKAMDSHHESHHAWKMVDDGENVKFVMKVPADVEVATEGHDKIVFYTKVEKKQELMDAIDADFSDFKLDDLKEDDEDDHIEFHEEGEKEVAKLTLPTAIDAEMCHHDEETNEVICVMPRDSVQKVHVKVVHDEF